MFFCVIFATATTCKNVLGIHANTHFFNPSVDLYALPVDLYKGIAYRLKTV